MTDRPRLIDTRGLMAELGVRRALLLLIVRLADALETKEVTS